MYVVACKDSNELFIDVVLQEARFLIKHQTKTLFFRSSLVNCCLQVNFKLLLLIMISSVSVLVISNGNFVYAEVENPVLLLDQELPYNA